MFVTALLRMERSELLQEMQGSVRVSERKRFFLHETTHIEVEYDSFVLDKQAPYFSAIFF